MSAPSVYIIPCLCGATVESHDHETTCPACGRVLDVSAWGSAPGKQEPRAKPEQTRLFETDGAAAFEPQR